MLSKPQGDGTPGEVRTLASLLASFEGDLPGAATGHPNISALT
jgi:hypothetical protein